MFKIGKKYLSIRTNVIVVIMGVYVKHIRVRVESQRGVYRVSYNDMNHFIRSGRLREVNDLSPRTTPLKPHSLCTV